MLRRVDSSSSEEFFLSSDEEKVDEDQEGEDQENEDQEDELDIKDEKKNIENDKILPKLHIEKEEDFDFNQV